LYLLLNMFCIECSQGKFSSLCTPDVASMFFYDAGEKLEKSSGHCSLSCSAFGFSSKFKVHE
jgi:hypothetical protein